jgi:hypothetical protein
MAITSFAQLQQFIANILAQNNQTVDAASAPHGAFWSNLTYDQFVNGDLFVKGEIDPAVKILVVGNSAQSNIILSLHGSGPLFNPNKYGQMPADGPPFLTDDQINEIAGWIDAGCPQ